MTALLVHSTRVHQLTSGKKQLISFAITGLVLFIGACPSHAQPFRYMDSSGNLFWVDRIEDIPMRYRNQVLAPTPVPPRTGKMQAKKVPTKKPVKKKTPKPKKMPSPKPLNQKPGAQSAAKPDIERGQNALEAVKTTVASE